jgi:hypothetical protein
LFKNLHAVLSLKSDKAEVAILILRSGKKAIGGCRRCHFF